MSAYVGKATAVASGSQSSVSVTYSPVAGNSLWLLITYDQSGPYALAANAIKDQANNNIPYIELGTGINIDASYTGAHVVYCPNVPSGVTSVKATMASTLTQGMGMTVVEYSGQSTVAAFAASTSNSNTSGTGTDNVVATATPNAQPGRVIAFSIDVVSSAAPSAGTGFTSRGPVAHALNLFTVNWAIEDKAYSSTSAQSATFSGTNAHQHLIFAAWVADQAAAATLSSPSAPSVADVGATGRVTSNTAGGTLHMVATSTSAQPTNAQIKAHSGGTIVAGASITPVNGSNDVSINSGLTASTNYWLWFLQDNGADSNVPTAVAITTTAPAPSVTATSNATPRNGSSVTVTVTNAGSSTGTLTLGGQAQTTTAWANTSVTFTVDKGSNKYGVPLALTVTNVTTGLTSATYSGITALLPQTGWSYVDLGTLNATAANRITAIADLAAGDQLAYDNKGGLVTVNPDGTFIVDSSVASFDVVAWTTGSGWGSTATQTIATTGAVLQDFVTAYSVLASAQQDFADTYSVLGFAQSDFASAYGVAGTMQVDFANAFAIAGPVQADFSESYAALDFAQADFASNYSIASSVVADYAGSFSVSDSVQLDLPSSYDIWGSATSDFIGIYTIVGAAPVDFTRNGYVGLAPQRIRQGNARAQITPDFVFSSKRPQEQEYFVANFGPVMLKGDAIAATSLSVTRDPGADVTASMAPNPVVVNGNKVAVLIRGGARNVTYHLRFTVTTSFGETLVLVGELPILE